MKARFKNSISSRKIKIGLLQHKARTLAEQLTLLCPNLRIAQNHFQAKAVGQFKLFLLGFSELVSHNNKMHFPKYRCKSL